MKIEMGVKYPATNWCQMSHSHYSSIVTVSNWPQRSGLKRLCDRPPWRQTAWIQYNDTFIFDCRHYNNKSFKYKKQLLNDGAQRNRLPSLKIMYTVIRKILYLPKFFAFFSPRIDSLTLPKFNAFFSPKVDSLTLKGLTAP